MGFRDTHTRSIGTLLLVVLLVTAVPGAYARAGPAASVGPAGTAIAENVTVSLEAPTTQTGAEGELLAGQTNTFGVSVTDGTATVTPNTSNASVESQVKLFEQGSVPENVTADAGAWQAMTFDDGSGQWTTSWDAPARTGTVAVLFVKATHNGESTTVQYRFPVVTPTLGPGTDGTNRMVLDPETNSYEIAYRPPATAQPEGIAGSVSIVATDAQGNPLPTFDATLGVDPNGREFSFATADGAQLRGTVVVEPTPEGNELGIALRGSKLTAGGEYTLSVEGTTADGTVVTEEASFVAEGDAMGATGSVTVGPVLTDLPANETSFTLTATGPEFDHTLGPGEGVEAGGEPFTPTVIEGETVNMTIERPAVGVEGGSNVIETPADTPTTFTVTLTEKGSGEVLTDANVEITIAKPSLPEPGNDPTSSGWHEMQYDPFQDAYSLAWNAPNAFTVGPEAMGAHGNLLVRVVDEQTGDPLMTFQPAEGELSADGLREFGFQGDTTDARLRGGFVVRASPQDPSTTVWAAEFGGDKLTPHTNYSVTIEGSGVSETLSFTTDEDGKGSAGVEIVPTALPRNESSLTVSVDGPEFDPATHRSGPGAGGEVIPFQPITVSSATGDVRMTFLEPTPLIEEEGAIIATIPDNQQHVFRLRLADANGNPIVAQRDDVRVEWQLVLAGQPQSPAPDQPAPMAPTAWTDMEFNASSGLWETSVSTRAAAAGVEGLQYNVSVRYLNDDGDVVLTREYPAPMAPTASANGSATLELVEPAFPVDAGVLEAQLDDGQTVDLAVNQTNASGAPLGTDVADVQVRLDPTFRTCNALAVGVDADGDGTIRDVELLSAIEHWRSGQPVAGTCGKVIAGSQVAVLTDAWRTDTTVGEG